MKNAPTKIYLISPNLESLLELTDEIQFTKFLPHDLEAYQDNVSPYQIKLKEEAIKAELFHLIQELSKTLK